MCSQSKIESTTQCVHVRTFVRAGATGILFQGRVTRCALVADKEQGTSAISSRFSIAQVYQNSGAAGCNTDIIGLDVAVNDRWALAMQKSYSIANRENPLHKTWQRNDLVFLAYYPHIIG